MPHSYQRSPFAAKRYLVSDFLAAVLAKAALIVLEALVIRLVQAFMTSAFRSPAPQAA
jgi:hypothetical protein